MDKLTIQTEKTVLKINTQSIVVSPVNSVNGKTGTVVLSAEDVGADSLGSAQAVQENVDSLSAEVDLKANADDVNAALALKANSADVDAQFTSLSSAVAAKANKAYVDQQDELLQDQIDLKANAQSVNQALSLKADLVDGKVPASQLPSFVDDVLEGTYINPTTFNDLNNQPYVPESGKIYVDTTSNKTYRWSGMLYVVISSGGVALGDTSETAYRGDRGKTAYDHSQSQGNPHNSTTSDITEGTRLYFTEPRVRSTVLTGLVLQNAPVVDTDNIVTAHGKFQGQLNNKTSLALGNTSTTALAGNSTTSVIAEGTNLYFTEARVRATPLTGFVTTNSSPIVATDNIVTALGKAQGQLNTLGATWVNITTTTGVEVSSKVDIPNTSFQVAKIDGSIWVRGRIRFKTNAVAGDNVFVLTQSSLLPDMSWYDPSWVLQRSTLYGNGTTISLDFLSSSIFLSLYMNISASSAATGANTTFHLPPTAISRAAS
ncbi:hypothetical protein F900_00731 [Acinetobacter modestus]|uniref:Uncharacterized protein n=1 Tax=Acinetobacter modestus TaxID=1776740 RepID=N9NLL6_9GAMM|nr:hypothetical protein [Acinetobacter modestus]ENX03637.1 hypothetical protein F900_00731 [Acinetobacter modestus]